jgi:hypothetical protein
MKRRICLFCGLLLLVTTAEVSGQPAPTRDELVRRDLSNVSADSTWIYNDLPKAFDLARALGKPLLVVFRCIPCEACAQLDQSIVERDARVRSLLDQYVCVRVIQANGMDLGLFQFDYDQSFAVFLMNVDKTIYGRYGTRSHQTRSEEDVSLEGFAEALEAGLQIHAGYPANRRQLAGKQPQTTPGYTTPEQFPHLKTFSTKLDYEGKVAASCIHCHQVGESFRTVLRDEGKPIPSELLFPYPHPKVLGLIMDPKQRATVAWVEPDSTAARDGFRAGDEMLSLAGQPLLSLADIQWVLHHTKDEMELAVSIRRGGQTTDTKLTLVPGWRGRGDISWRATSWDLRRMTTGGMHLEDLPPDRRAERKLGNNSLALEATYLGEWGEHAHAKNQGFKPGDVIVSLAGQSRRMRESDFFAQLVNRPIGEEVAVGVLRGEQPVELRLKMQK